MNNSGITLIILTLKPREIFMTQVNFQGIPAMPHNYS